MPGAIAPKAPPPVCAARRRKATSTASYHEAFRLHHHGPQSLATSWASPGQRGTSRASNAIVRSSDSRSAGFAFARRSSACDRHLGARPTSEQTDRKDRRTRKSAGQPRMKRITSDRQPGRPCITSDSSNAAAADRTACGPFSHTGGEGDDGCGRQRQAPHHRALQRQAHRPRGQQASAMPQNAGVPEEEVDATMNPNMAEATACAARTPKRMLVPLDCLTRVRSSGRPPKHTADVKRQAGVF